MSLSPIKMELGAPKIYSFSFVGDSEGGEFPPHPRMKTNCEKNGNFHLKKVNNLKILKVSQWEIFENYQKYG